MISKKMANAMNKRIAEEIYSAYLYLSMANRAAAMGLKGFANWFFVQMQEELSHAQKFYTYCLDQGHEVTFEAIPKPPAEFKTPVELFERSLEHEKMITANINKLMTLAHGENDHATAVMLQWFVTEQVEEEVSATDILQQLKMVGGSGGSLLMIDRQLAKRTFTPLQSGE
jgi:ferritin